MTKIYCKKLAWTLSTLVTSAALSMISASNEGHTQTASDRQALASIRTTGRNDAKLFHDWVRTPIPGSAPNELLLQINLVLTEQASAYFCHRPDAARNLYRGTLAFGALPFGKKDGEPYIQPELAQNLFLVVARDGSSPNDSFDLWRFPEDICVGRIEQPHSSPPISVITKEAISGALAKLSASDAQRRCLDYDGGAYLPPPGQLCRFQPPQRLAPADKFEH